MGVGAGLDGAVCVCVSVVVSVSVTARCGARCCRLPSAAIVVVLAGGIVLAASVEGSGQGL